MLHLTAVPPLGVGVSGELADEHREVLPPGAVLVAYSDGLVERRDADLDDQLALLARAVSTACEQATAGTASDIAARILTTLVPHPEQAEDDVCLLVVRRRA